MTLKFKTNINCGGCKAKVTPFLNAKEGISNWAVDLDNPEKILSVDAKGITPQEVVETVAKAGFTAEKIEG